MSEELTREIIGLAHKSKWVRVKEFIKLVVLKTLKEDTGYFVLAIDAVIKKKRMVEYDFLITKKAQIKEIDEINDFSNFSLYQISDTTNDHISVSKENNVIIVLSKFFGPEVDHAKFFDFTVHLDSLNNPFFSDGTGNPISCSEMLNLVKKGSEKESPPKQAVKELLKIIEKLIMETLIQEEKFSDADLKLKDIKNIAKRYNLSEIISWTDGMLHLCNKLEKTESLKKKFPMVENLIREMKFSNAIRELNNIKKIAKKNSLDEILSWTEENLILCNKLIIKKTVLELGSKFPRLQIAEISEVCGLDDVQLIVHIIKDMIDNKEIYAQYFSSTKSIAFDQQANIEEIDKLMKSYKEWEDKKVGKN